MKKLLLLLISVWMFAACSSSQVSRKKAYRGHAMSESSGFSALSIQTEKVHVGDLAYSEVRKLIYNATMELAVKQPDSVNPNLERIAKKYGGYTQDLGTSRSTIRVSADKLNEALEEIAALGKVKNRSVYGDDITERYYNTQIRLENAQNARKRYLELLAKAENVEAALKVEKELERLNGEIDMLQGQLNRMKHLSEYSTITVRYEERMKPGVVGYVFIGLYESVKWLFVRN